MLKKNRLLVIFFGVLILLVSAFVINKFFLNQKIQLKSEKSGNINILILGRGGGTHDGPDLTDTIILGMVNPSRNEADIISIPRDLWLPDLKEKINTAYAIGQAKNKQGTLLAKAAVEKVTGQNIDYTVVIDFSGFVKLVDYLGGIDVNVANTLDDYSYPIEGKEKDTCGHPEQEIKDFTATASAETDLWDYFSCRYKHLHVNSGTQHMAGEQALEFSRSRHGINGEGSDFARSRRQEEVISAVKNKVLSLGIIINPIKVIGIFNILKDNIDTNIQFNEFDDFINLARKMQGAKIKSYVIDIGDQGANRFGLLVEPIPTEDTGFQSILAPRTGNGNFLEIHDYIMCIASGHICEVSDEGIIKDPLPSPNKKSK